MIDESFESVTILANVTAPTIVETMTNARRLATSGRNSRNCAAMMSTIFNNPSVATARVLSLDRASSLPNDATF
jgi:hypothetical protein